MIMHQKDDMCHDEIGLKRSSKHEDHSNIIGKDHVTIQSEKKNSPLKSCKFYISIASLELEMIIFIICKC